mmetsp:Transcript_35598/g.60008  ORF Transcript_35598/g.60008 Transcript_35598/m.60008 type:complete len:90 (-) Transcript_35598:43-312(-)
MPSECPGGSLSLCKNPGSGFVSSGCHCDGLSPLCKTDCDGGFMPSEYLSGGLSLCKNCGGGFVSRECLGSGLSLSKNCGGGATAVAVLT